MASKNILWFKEAGIKDVPMVGGKNASLGEMIKNLIPHGVNIPDGFATTAGAYFNFLEKTGLKNKIKEILKDIDVSDLKSLHKKGGEARALIENSELPEELETEIIDAYHELSREYGKKNVDVAVRSSATAEDLPNASFAGQQETYLNVVGEKNVLESVKLCIASLFTDRAIAYRAEMKFDHMQVGLSVGIQKMVRADIGSSGVMFSCDTESGFGDVVLINASYGLGENIVQGKVDPDQYYVFETTLKKGFKPILEKKLGAKQVKMIYASEQKKFTKNIPVPLKDRQRFVLSNDEILSLSRWSILIEDHYKKSMDIEWAKDGRDGKLYIVQARPETVQSRKNLNVLEEYVIDKSKSPKVLITGASVGNKIGQGKANRLLSVKDIVKFKEGEVLVTDMTDPDWVVAMKKASAIVTDRGGRTCFVGDTKILTDKGFLTMKEAHKKIKKTDYFNILSLDSKTNKITWRPVVDAFKKSGKIKKFFISPTLRTKQNFIESTPDHKFLTLSNRSLIKKGIADIVSSAEGVLIANKIWPNNKPSNSFGKEFYLLGALMTDGHASINKQGGYTVGFTQKLTPSKDDFINTVKNYFKDVCGEELKLATIDKRGNCGNFRCYSKKAYHLIKSKKEGLLLNTLSADEDSLLNFLAGVLDGDGNISDHQIQITIGKKKALLLELVQVTALRLGISPTICRVKDWYVVSFNKSDIYAVVNFTKRVKFLAEEKTKISYKFVSRQVIHDVIDLINYRGRMKTDYITNENMISALKMERAVLPMVGDKYLEFEKIIKSDFHMNRVECEHKKTTKKIVYDLTVDASDELDHNYVIFTKNYTPVIVSNCHAAIVGRELGVPTVVGTGKVTKVVKSGKEITVSCAEGEQGKVYEGIVPFNIKRTDISKLGKTKVKISMNLGEPDQAFGLSFIPNDGVGLAREEFIIANAIKIHPMALLNYKKEKPALRKKIDAMTFGYKDKTEFYVDKLAEGVAKIGAAFYPKQVIVRFSDFKTNEYRSLVGGEAYEPKEENPMIGWRGASRYYDPKFKEAFGLECKAIKKVREVFGLDNVMVMVPFCRTVEEGKKVIEVMKEYGLQKSDKGLKGESFESTRSDKDLKVFVMCEIPSNVIMADEFLEIFDGFSIGSNDLTQLTLGLDRDSSEIAHIGNEKDNAVKKLLKLAIQKCKEKGKYSGICGQGPSDFPDFAEFLMKEGIESMSLNPDSIIKTRMMLIEKEKGIQQAENKPASEKNI